MTRRKILYLEDEHYLGRIVKESLVSRQYDVMLVSDGNRFITVFDHFKPDICILDIMVPNLSGLEVSRKIRSKQSDIPIIFLTAKGTTEDVLEGFKSGGNDYIKKPFSIEELIARIENLLKLKGDKNGRLSTSLFDFGLSTYDYYSQEIRCREKLHTLSHRENELLYMLCTHLNQKVERKDILVQLWGSDSLYNSRNLDVYIRRLRIYLEDEPRLGIVTLRGVGYKLRFN